MSNERVLFSADREDIQRAIARMVTLRVLDVFRLLDQIRDACDDERHCAYGPPKCPACTAVDNFAVKIRALLPDLPAVPGPLERRADSGGEDDDARHASDPRRPGPVTPDP